MVSSTLVASLEDLVRQTDGNLQGVLCGSVSENGTEVRSCRPVAGFAPESMARAARERDVVGYYHVRQADSMRLDAMESAIADRHFSRPGSVVLLIKRTPGEAQANFFFRENGTLVNLSLLMFPLSVAAMQKRQPAVEMALDVPTAPSARKRAASLAAAVVVAAIAGVGGSMLFLRHRDAVPRSTDSASRAATASLPLRAERQGDDLKIVWDLNAASIASAVSGVLDIDDGGEKRRIPLDARQVRFGSVLYTPKSDQVSIDFTAVKDDGSAGQASVLVLLTKTAPGETARSVRNVPVVGDARVGADRARELSNEPKRPVAPSRPFVPPVEHPKVAPAGAPENLPAVQLAEQRVTLLPLPGPVAPPRPAGTVATPNAPTGGRAGAPASAVAPLTTVHIPAGKFTPPEIVAQAGPRVPPELRLFVTRPFSVNVRVHLDETGRVIRADAEKQKVVHVGFLSAATEAAMHCRFRPARRGDTPVSSEAILTFHFQP